MFMKTSRLFGILSTAMIFAACAPSASQLQKTLEDHPEAFLSAIEKNPEKFMAVVQKAAQQAQMHERENEQKDEAARVEKELKNPLQPTLPADRAWRGPKDAPITIVVYSDFQCPYCGRGFQTEEQILKEYGPKVRMLFKELPLPMHPLALPAARRYEAISIQSTDKAIKFHDEVFTNQSKLGAEGEKFLDGVAKKVGANVAQMKKDMDGEEVGKRLEADKAEAEKFGFSGTPGYVVSGVSVRGAYPFSAFKEIIDKKLASAK